MENIFVESDKSYKQGFLITEQELRRLVEVITDQLKKSNKEVEPKLSYIIKFKNGVIATTENLNEIFSLENGGLGEIMRFQIKGNIGEKEDLHEITIEFEREKSNERNYYGSAIKHNIKGKSRDWVFVTSSLIEERVNKLKPNGTYIFSKNRIDDFLLFIPILILMLTSLTFFQDFFEATPSYVNEIETKWKSNEISDPIEVLIAFEKKKGNVPAEPLKYMLGVIFCLVVLYYLIKLFIKRYYPQHNFCWGDYQDEYNRKEKVRKNFITLFIIGIIVSIIGGLIANYLGK